MRKNELTTNIINVFFSGASPQDLQTHCPNCMLWEAIRASDANVITQQDVLDFLLLHEAFYVLQEPFPAICNGSEVGYLRIERVDLPANGKTDVWDFSKTEPTYIVGCDYSWMIVLTTENTQCGTQLCVLIYAK